MYVEECSNCGAYRPVKSPTDIKEFWFCSEDCKKEFEKKKVLAIHLKVWYNKHIES